MTKKPTHRSEEILQQAVRHLKSGELVAFPTETVYGLGAIVSQPKAIKKVYEAKGRSLDNPVNLTVDSIALATRYVEEIPPKALLLMRAFWPGPLTIVLKRNPVTVPDIVTAGQQTVALRMPNQADTLKLIHLVGEALVGPSANQSGRPSPTSVQHVSNDLGDRVQLILDGGQTALGIESTIIDLTQGEPVILRSGEVSQSAIEAVIGAVVTKEEEAPAHQRPHYQPRTPVSRIKGSAEHIQQFIKTHEGQRIGLALPTALIEHVQLPEKTTMRLYNMGQTIPSYKRKLYDVLRRADRDELSRLILYEVPETPESSSLIQRIRLISE